MTALLIEMLGLGNVGVKTEGTSPNFSLLYSCIFCNELVQEEAAAAPTGAVVRVRVKVRVKGVRVRVKGEAMG